MKWELKPEYEVFFKDVKTPLDITIAVDKMILTDKAKNMSPRVKAAFIKFLAKKLNGATPPKRKISDKERMLLQEQKLLKMKAQSKVSKQNLASIPIGGAIPPLLLKDKSMKQ